MNIQLTTSQKIGVVYGILVILLVIALGIRFLAGERLKNQTQNKSGQPFTEQKSIKKTPLAGKLSLVIDKTSYNVGEQIELTILYSAAGKVLDGIDVVLRFDPTIVNALGFSPTGAFKLYPRKDIDNQDGTVKLTALDSSSSEPLPKEKLSLGKITLQAIEAGTAQVNFDFIEGETSKTTMTEAGTSKNILGEASGVAIRVE